MNVQQSKFGHYRLESRLGSNGTSEVWHAWDVRTDRQVALKVLVPWLANDTEYVKRFRREAALAARLSGPHIVPINDYGEIDGQLYIEMQPVEGTDLATLLKRGPLPLDRAVEIIAQVADGLDTVHRAELVHRDVTPSNVLVSDGGGGRDVVYLMDFGVASAVHGTTLSLSGSVIGTPAYMAPEEFETAGDHRGDLYALACVLHEVLTGQPPFNNSNLLGLRKLHRDAPPPRPSALRAGVPPRLDDVIARGMAKNPSDRYPSALELAAEARQALHSGPEGITEPERVGPPAPAETGSGSVRAPRRPGLRRRVVVAALGAVAALVITSGIIAGKTGGAVIGTQTPAAPTPTRSAVVAKIPVGVEPSDPAVSPSDPAVSPSNLAVSPDGARLYVINRSSNTISVVDTASRAVVDTIAVKAAQNISLTPDGRKAYVGTDLGLVSLDLTTKAQQAIPLAKGQGQSVAVAPDGRRAYVATFHGRSIAVVDTTSEQVIANVPLGRTAMDVAVSPDGSTVYAAVSDYNATDYGNISVIDAARATITTTIATPPYPSRNYVTVSPDGSTLYADGYSGSQLPSIEMLNAQSGTVSGYIAVGVNGPVIGALSTDGKTAYVTETASTDLFVVDTVSRVLSRTIPLDTAPTSVALDPTGRFAYVASHGVASLSSVSDTSSVPGFVYVVDLS